MPSEASEREGRGAERGRAAKRAALLVGALVLVLAPLGLRVLVDGRAELASAEAAADRGDLDAEIRHLGRAARFRLPLARHDDAAVERLAELAREREAERDWVGAEAAWRELRRALIGTRVVGVRDPELLSEANAAIVELMVRDARTNGRPLARERWTEELEQDLAPRGRSLLAALCFTGWMFASVGFFLRGIDAKGRLNPRSALRWGGPVLLLLTGWILLM